MRLTYATLLLDEAGAEIDESNLVAVLEAVGSEPDRSRVKATVAALEGIDIGRAAEALGNEDHAEAAETPELTISDEADDHVPPSRRSPGEPP